MPGLVGLVGERAQDQVISDCLASISHFDSYVSKSAAPGSAIRVGQVWRREKEVRESWCQDAGTGAAAFVNGTAIQAGATPTRISAREVLDAYLNGDLAPESYDGGFVAMIYDPRNHKVVLFNDRLGSLPLYYASDAKNFCFGPEPKAVFSGTNMPRRYSADGVTTFMTLGFCLADTTLFADLHFLEPGTVLTLDTQSLRYSLRRYWSLQFEPDSELSSRGRGEEALHEAFLDGHRTSLGFSDETYDLLLSGGWDSRGLLGAAAALNRPPRRTVSWGLREDVPGSDPFIARQFAEQFELQHRFISYDSDSFVDNAAEWTRITELSTDNFGWYGEGTTILLNEYMGGADFVVAGDHGYGCEGFAGDKSQAMAAMYMPTLIPDSITSCLSPEAASGARDRYLAEVDKVLKPCNSEIPNDQKDFLYIHGRVHRFIFSLGYYKELAVEVRRPFLSTQNLDIVEKIPPRLRYNKNLYLSMMLRYFPALYNIGQRSADSLPLWRHDLRTKPALADLFQELLSEQVLRDSAIGEYLDVAEVRRLVDEFYSVVPERQKPPTRLVPRANRWVQFLRHRVTSVDNLRVRFGVRQPFRQALSDFDLLKRIALLVLYERHGTA